MSDMTRRRLESALARARQQHAEAVADVRRQLQQADDPQYSSSVWRNLASTAVEGAVAAGRVDAYVTALAMLDAHKE